MWDTFDLVVFNVIFELFGTLAIFRRYEFPNASSSTLMTLIQPNVLEVFPATVYTKLFSWNIEI